MIRPRTRLPAPTIRLRLTLVYGALFLACGASLLTVTYFLVRQHYTSGFFQTSGRAAVVFLTEGRHGGAGAGLVGSSHRGGPAKAAAPTLVNKGSASGGPNRLPGGPDPRVVAAVEKAQASAALHQLLVDSGIALAIMALFSIWLGWIIAGRALRPLRTITNAAREISASSLHRRLALTGPEDELKQLGATFDSLLARLEASFEAQRQFVAHASHELRTPLTLARTLLEVAIKSPNADAAKLRIACEKAIQVGEKQERLIEALLTLSRSQRGLEHHEPIDLAAIAAATTAEAEDTDITFETSFKAAHTSGDLRLVERLIANLIGNAVRHNIPGGHVYVETDQHDGRAVINVANSGPIVPSDEIARLFQPFQRGANSRSDANDGLGLGLSIVEAVATAHNAILTATANDDGGLRISVSFPPRSAFARPEPRTSPIADTPFVEPTGATRSPLATLRATSQDNSRPLY